MRLTASIFALTILAMVACSSSDDESMQYQDGLTGQDVPQQDAPDQSEPDTALPEDTAEPDTYQPDTAPPDTGQDSGLEDLGEPDTTAEDIVEDTPTPDTSPAQDTTQVDPLVAACQGFFDNLCSEVLAACQSLPFAGALITPEVMNQCHQFLTSQQQMIDGTCQLLTEPSTDPTIEMIRNAGPPLLEQCTANFECDPMVVPQLIELLIPMFQGGQFEATDLLQVIVAVCL